MTMPEFRRWPKTPRLHREVWITEKIDGTNACVIVTDNGVFAQSRKCIITPDFDNFGFAKWVQDNAETLAADLGPGYHFGEWWGSGIQRGYGYKKGERFFSLFNTRRHAKREEPFVTPNLGVVPVLFHGVFDYGVVQFELDVLAHVGSYLNHETPAEGICIYFVDADQVFKVLLENDDQPKSLVQERNAA